MIVPTIRPSLALTCLAAISSILRHNANRECTRMTTYGSQCPPLWVLRLGCTSLLYTACCSCSRELHGSTGASTGVAQHRVRVRAVLQTSATPVLLVRRVVWMLQTFVACTYVPHTLDPKTSAHVITRWPSME